MKEYFILNSLIKILDAILSYTVGKTLEELFPTLFKNENLEIVKDYEKRLQKREKKIESLESRTRETQLEKMKILTSLKRRNLSTEKLIEKYDKPLNAILVSYSAQKVKTKSGRLLPQSFLRGELERFDARYLGGTDSLIPPSKVPKWIRDEKDLERWFKRNILKGRHCKLKFLALVDLKKKTTWNTYLPYVQKAPLHKSIGEVLRIEDLFTEDQIRRIAISEVIMSGDLAWLASTVLKGDELEVILDNQRQIEKQLGNPSLRLLSQGSIKSKLSKVLSRYIKRPASVAKEIVGEAKFWHEKLKG